ncbi:MAG TPA: DUF4251 domain-containing protein [Cyclobacteriaceae bacterium]|jgi:hypothetical protein|nr:DUF4251 domain-containing protein [Cyclobacteriaceae bacterium]
MKTTKIGLIAILLIGSIGLVNAQSTQEKKDNRKSQRIERKAQREAEAKMMFDKARKLVEEKNLVLEAITVRGKYGSTVNVGPNNFIMVDNDDFVLQTAFVGGVGFNGLGGITAKGKVTSYQISQNENNNMITVLAQVSTSSIGQGTLTIQVGISGNASATFVNNWGGRIEFNGSIESVQESKVYEGMRRL